MLTMLDAERALGMVMATYEGYIPSELKSKTASDIFIFCEEDDYARRFKHTYDTAFKQANSVLIKGTISPLDISGFVTAVADHSIRKVCMPKRESVKWTTLVHEALHYLSHENFYPIYYLVGGQHPFQVEGATEYFTRATSPSNSDLKSRQNYQSHYLKTDAWLENNRGNYMRMVDFLFKGIATNMDAIHK